MLRKKAEAAGTQVRSVSWPSTTQIPHGARHSRQAYPQGLTATSSTARLVWALVKERRTSELLLAVILWSPYCICRFWIGFDGSLTVTIGPRQAVAVHVGAVGIGSPTPKAASQVSVIFAEVATTSPGEVSTISFVGVLSDQTYCTVNHAPEYLRGRQHTATR
jgi:hypothetical protein